MFDSYSDSERRSSECRYCGKGGLHWEDDDGAWILCKSNGEIHKCDPARVKKASGCDFEDLDK